LKSPDLEKLDVLALEVDFDGVVITGRTALNKLALYWAIALYDVDWPEEEG
jgi:hypothetical protein